MGVRWVAVATAWAAMAAPAQALDFTAWDGSNPFNCELQQAGFAGTGPDPNADPYCVQFDKTRQNVTELGLVDFLAKEPERLAAAGDRCFYFQADHWRGSIVQDDAATKTYEWIGHYMVDRARGVVAGWITDANLNGHTYDFSTAPFMPPAFRAVAGPGRIGGAMALGIPVEPRCADRAQREPPVYARGPEAAAAAPKGRRGLRGLALRR